MNPSMQGFLLPLMLVVVFYFFVIRPQSKRTKTHQQMLNNLQKGDEVITSGGILGKVVNLTDQFFIIAVQDNLEMTVQRQAIQAILPKGTLKSLRQKA